MKKKLILVCETLDGTLKTPVNEMACFAAACGISPDDAALVIAGWQVTSLDDAASVSGMDIITVENAVLRYHNPPALARVAIEICRQTGAGMICFPHTMQSCSAAVLVSASSGCRLITSVEEIRTGNRSLEFTRSVYNGKIQEKTKLETGESFVCTIQSGSFAGKDAENVGLGKIFPFAVDVESGGFFPESFSEADESAVSLNDADVIVAAGRGVGKEENLGVIYETARIFQNSAVGASRIVCDNGWIPYGQQVGMTGKTVTPRLYIACGISGSQQHIVGMKNSQFIVAINSDPHANIFSTAHIGVVDDLNLFLPVFIEKCKKMV